MASYCLDNFRKEKHLGVMIVRCLFIHEPVSTEAYNHCKHLTFLSGLFMTALLQCFVMVFPNNPRVQSIHSRVGEISSYFATGYMGFLFPFTAPLNRD